MLIPVTPALEAKLGGSQVQGQPGLGHVTYIGQCALESLLVLGREYNKHGTEPSQQTHPTKQIQSSEGQPNIWPTPKQSRFLKINALYHMLLRVVCCLLSTIIVTTVN
jgi:hypothetical protein